MTPTSERGAWNRGRVASDPLPIIFDFADRRHAYPYHVTPKKSRFWHYNCQLFSAVFCGFRTLLGARFFYIERKRTGARIAGIIGPLFPSIAEMPKFPR